MSRSALLLSLAVAGCAAPHPEIALVEVGKDAGLSGETYSGSTLHNLGVAWIDFDRDGWPDVFAVNGHNRDAHLYRNLGDGSFERVDGLLPELAQHEQAGAVFADYDNDGDEDLYVQVTNEQFDLFTANEVDGPPNLLLRNRFVEDGEVSFEEVAAHAGVADEPAEPLANSYSGRRGMTGGWFDYDRDGCVDLFVGNMALQAAGHPGNRSSLYRNLCDGTFEDVTITARINSSVEGDPLLNRPALAWLGADLNDDQWPDMYVVNVHEPTPWHEDFLFRNTTQSNFAEEIDRDGSMPGIGDDSGGGMGIDTADIDLDGDWDLYISDIYRTEFDAQPLGNVLYLNQGDGRFDDNTAPESGVEGSFSWGVSFFDLDRDGYEDLFVAVQGGVNHLFHNQGDGTFVDIAAAAGLRGANSSRGSATADYDRDGDVDLLFVNNGGSLKLYRNDSANTRAWLSVKLSATTSNGSAIGTLIRATTDDGVMRMRQVKGGSSAHSQDELVMHFGLGEIERIETLEILWPSGIVDVMTEVERDQLVEVVEGCCS
ncbi:MAG: CRTAC1 family protein [Proteobacteria bacterium]|nr:CRTAC1 family protein [Pseudomonadota bacterium]